MASQVELNVSKFSLGVVAAQNTGSGEGAQATAFMVGHEKRLGGLLAETLSTTPGHVLDAKKGSIADKDVVEISVSNDGTRRLLDDIRDDGERGWFRVILSINEDRVFRTLGPFLKGGIDGLLHVGAIEVDICSGR